MLIGDMQDVFIRAPILTHLSLDGGQAKFIARRSVALGEGDFLATVRTAAGGVGLFV